MSYKDHKYGSFIYCIEKHTTYHEKLLTENNTTSSTIRKDKHIEGFAKRT